MKPVANPDSFSVPTVDILIQTRRDVDSDVLAGFGRDSAAKSPLPRTFRPNSRNYHQCGLKRGTTTPSPSFLRKPIVNFKKLLIIIAAVVVLVCVWKFFTRVDRSNPVAVATAFTKAMKKQDTSTASKFYLPEKADEWRQKTDDAIQAMRSGTMASFFERIPDAPTFTAPITAAGKTVITTADKAFAVEITQIDGKWYISKTNF